MKKFKIQKAYLLLTLVLGVFMLLPGCSSNEGGGGEWDKPVSIDTTIPTVTFTDPITVVAPGVPTSGVAINKKVSATFSEEMASATISTATFTLKNGSTPVAGTVDYSGVTAVFTPASNLANSTTYTATIGTGATDLAGNGLAANHVWIFTTGAALDATAPTVTGTINANGATNVALNTKVGATFSESMDPLSITNSNFTLKATVGGASVSGTVGYSGVSAVFIPASPLASSTSYTVTVKGGAGGVKDLAGNYMINDFVITWTTGAAPDTTAPRVTGTINANGATNVALNAKVGATFSEAMGPLTITNLNFSLRETVSGNAVGGTVSYSGVSALFIPASPLAANTSYTVTVKGGVGGVEDLAGNHMVDNFVIHWSTGGTQDNTAPRVTGTINSNGATNVAVNTNAGATFSEAMDHLTITNLNFILKETNSGNAVAGVVSYSGVNALFIPANALAFNTRYTVTVKGGANGVKDLAGNHMASDYVWSWTTGAALDTVAPFVIRTINADGAINVPLNTKIGATFSEAMNHLTITNLNFSAEKSLSHEPVLGVLSYSGGKALFIPQADLAPSTRYTMTIKSGLNGVKDLAGNQMANDYVWSWTTGAAQDLTAPTVTLTNPANLVSGVPLNSTVTAKFSEDMDGLTISNVTFSVAGVPGLVNYDALSRVATFDPTSDLAPSTTYTATITNSVKDLAGNGLVSGLVPNPWTFTTGAAVVPPSLVNLGLADTFGIASTAGITNTVTAPISHINGDVVFNPTATCSGVQILFADGPGFGLCGGKAPTINGTVVTPLYPDAVTAQPITDALRAAYLTITPANMPGGVSIAAGTTLGAPVGNPFVEGDNLFYPGVYTSNTSILITGDLTLDAQGDPNATFVFQSASTVGTAPNAKILLAGGAKASNVWWQAGSDATLGTSTIWNGNILAYRDITMNTGATSCGRLFAGAFTDGAFVLDSNVVSVPGNGSAPPTCQ
ncbi:MAG: DUF3494 domain-containing protein [Desulfobulbaceae bacterium]|nr:DUF3494 domain-containing protein [Desulfobulbaceae bacterium]